MASFGIVWYSMLLCGILLCAMVLCGIIWYIMLSISWCKHFTLVGAGIPCYLLVEFGTVW